MEDPQWQKMTEVFRSVFENRSIVVSEKTTGDDIIEWDSLNHVQLILAVETAFRIRFRHSEIAAFENVGDMMQAVKRQLNL